MPTEPRSHSANPTVTSTPVPITPPEIAAVIDRLAAAIKAADGNCDLFAGWAVATLAAKLKITVAMSSSDDPAQVVQDLGEGWADQAVELLKEEPNRPGDTLRAAHAVVRRLLVDVSHRGPCSWSRPSTPSSA